MIRQAIGRWLLGIHRLECHCLSLPNWSLDYRKLDGDAWEVTIRVQGRSWAQVLEVLGLCMREWRRPFR